MSLAKKILLWVGGAVLLVALVAGGGVYIVVYRQNQKTLREESERRSQRKVHIGDSPQMVRLRSGVADSAANFGDSLREDYWFYGSFPSEPGLGAVIVFDSLKRVDRIFTLGDFLWTPEDGLDPGIYADVDATIQSFHQTLGAPCDTSFATDSVWVRFYYPLSREESSQDSVYREWDGPSAVIRFLQVDLQKGKRVDYHGWTEASSKSRCGATHSPRN